MVSIDDSPANIVMKDQGRTKVTEAKAGKQGPNGLETPWNNEEVARTAEIIEQIAAGWADSTIAVKVLRVLCDLARENPERLDPRRDRDTWGFGAPDIGERLLERFKIVGALGWDKDQDKARRRMNEYWLKLEEAWKRQGPTIVDGMEASRIPLRPRPTRREGGGTGKRTHYGFRFEDEQGPQSLESHPPINILQIPHIQYRHQDISGNRLVRWISDRGFYLGGWGGRIYFSIFLVPVVLIMFWIWLLVIAINAASTSLAIIKAIPISALTIWIAYLLFDWQIRLIKDRVTLAPWIMQPWSKQDDYLLELRGAEGATRNTIFLVRYIADCPICGAQGLNAVQVQSGRREFFGRLVGRCKHAPNAHIFSFDHISKQGRFLR